MRVIVCGSRTWNDLGLIERAFARLPPKSTVLHGGAEGADKMAGRIAHRLGFEVEVYPADWLGYGPSAGPLRNQQMVERGADVCIAFRMPGISRGTDDCVRRCREAGMRVLVVTPDGKVKR